jgi:hypothetical protein
MEGLTLAEERARTKARLPPGGIPGAAAPAAPAAPAAGAYADPAKEARYQAWKASQGIP